MAWIDEADNVRMPPRKRRDDEERTSSRAIPAVDPPPLLPWNGFDINHDSRYAQLCRRLGEILADDQWHDWHELIAEAEPETLALQDQTVEGAIRNMAARGDLRIWRKHEYVRSVRLAGRWQGYEDGSCPECGAPTSAYTSPPIKDPQPGSKTERVARLKQIIGHEAGPQALAFLTATYNESAEAQELITSLIADQGVNSHEEAFLLFSRLFIGMLGISTKLVTMLDELAGIDSEATLVELGRQVNAVEE